MRANKDGTFSVNKPDQSVTFVVDLYALTCSCIHFEQKWANKSVATRAKNMTPCLHMATAATFATRRMPWDKYRLSQPEPVQEQSPSVSPFDEIWDDEWDLARYLGLI